MPNVYCEKWTIFVFLIEPIRKMFFEKISYILFIVGIEQIDAFRKFSYLIETEVRKRIKL